MIEYGSVLGALLFGAYHHYVLISPDNIGHLPSGSPESHAAFIASAAVLTLLELASALSGAFCLFGHTRCPIPSARLTRQALRRGKDQEGQWPESVRSRGARLESSRESFKACSGWFAAAR